MSSAKITLFTFAKYMQQNDDDLFKNLNIPSSLNKDTLTENILLRGGEFEVIYSDPLFMQYAIGTWSKKWYRTMDKWMQALNLEYNPLENYDRYENIQDKNEKTSTMDRTLDHEDATIINTKDLRTLDTQNKRTLDTDELNTRNLMDEENRNLTDKETRDLQDVTTYDHDTEVEEQVSAYDSSSYQPSKVTYNKDSDEHHNTVTLDQDGTDTFEHTGKDIFNHTGYDDKKNTGTDTMYNTGTDTLDRTGTETTGHTGTIKDDGSEDSFNDHIGHIHGNIGVTSSQDLLMQELSVDEWNIYEHITDLFLTEFVIPIYT